MAFVNETNITTEFNISKIYNSVFGYVGPPFPAIEKDFESAAKNLARRFNPLAEIGALIGQYKTGQYGVTSQFPVNMETDNLSFDFPIEPIVNIRGGNKIIRRFPKRSNNLGGSVKESWTRDDYSIEIKGVFINDVEDDKPFDYMTFLRTICEGVSAKMSCRLTEVLGIYDIVIQDYSFPSVPATRVQPYVIKAYSDAGDYNLLQG